MSRQVIDPYDTPGNFIFGSEIEVAAGAAKLLAQVVGAEAELYAKLDENEGLVAIDSSGNDRHGAFQGGYTENQWTTGKINSCIFGLSSTNGFINFDQLLEFEYNEPFSFECWVNFTSTVFQTLISKHKNTGLFEGVSLNCSNGKLRIVIRDISLNIIAVETAALYNTGSWHHVVGTYDGSGIVSGLKLKVNNVYDTVVSSSDTLSATIKSDVDFQISGREGNQNCILSSTKIDEVLVYDRELTSAEISFRWNGGAGTQIIPGSSTSFPTNNPPIVPKSNVNATQVLSFDATITATGLDEIRFVVLVNNNDFWWDGLTWSTSSGYSETNTLAEISANILTLDLGENGQPFDYKAYLHSEDGSTTPELSEVSFEYDFFTGDIIVPNQCLVYGYVYNENNDPVEGVIIKINPSCNIEVYDGTAVSSYEEKTVFTNSLGFWAVYLTETASMNINYIFQFIDNEKTKFFKRSVPDEIMKNFSELTEF